MKPQAKKPENYIKVRHLGTGSFGKAYLVKGEQSAELSVIKEIDINQMTDGEKKEALKEAKIMEGLHHPNIVRFKEVYKTKKGSLCIVMDYADGGDLLQKIKTARGNYFPESQILDWFTQIALAIKHCHDRKILHRDLKAQNIFLTAKSCVKLGDFGIAKVLEKTQDKAKTIVGTPYYLSPEIIQSKPYSYEADIWSLGVLLYEMCALRPPFDSNSLSGLVSRIIAGTYPPLPSKYSDSLKALVGQILTVDPTKRPTIHQILATPLIHNRIRAFLDQTLYNMEFAHTILHGKTFEQIKAMSVPLVNVYQAKSVPETDSTPTRRAVVPAKQLPLVKAPIPTLRQANQFLAPPKLIPDTAQHKKTRTPSPKPHEKEVLPKLGSSPTKEKRRLVQNYVTPQKPEEPKPVFVQRRPVSSTPDKKRVVSKGSDKSLCTPSGRPPISAKPAFVGKKIGRNIVRYAKGFEKRRGNSSVHDQNDSGLHPAPSFDSAVKGKKYYGDKKVVKMKKRVNVMRKVDPKGEELGKQVTELCKHMMDMTINNKKEIEACDKDIVNMINEMEKVRSLGREI